MKMSTRGQPAEGHLWLVFTMLFVTSAVRSVGASSFAPPPSVSVSSPAYDPVIKVVGKVYCYRCFDEAHPDESHGKKHLQGETSCLPLLLRSHRANAVSWKMSSGLLIFSILSLNVLLSFMFVCVHNTTIWMQEPW